MDLFTRTFLPAATDAGLPMPVISRHLPVVRRCLGPADAVLMVARCVRADRPHTGSHLIVLTRNRMVVTREGLLARRVRLHIDAPVHELSQVAWHRDPHSPAVDLAATAVDGIRERFRIMVPQPRTAWLVDAVLGQVFLAAGPAATSASAPACPRPEPRPTGRLAVVVTASR